ncbi:MAG: hypothetical protein RMJ14_05795 [Nitrososphaerota archaeon]|nr:hypothetical protein [Aigarchaeota archaeon]MDW8077127.1 hypothetical protein [Nitrososphaerota archaeon]
MPKNVNVILGLPPNNSLTSLLIYEGLLYLINNVPARIDVDRIKIPADGIMHVYGSLDDKRILDKIYISTVGINDEKSIKTFLKELGIKYDEFLTTIKKEKTKEELEEILKRLGIKSDGKKKEQKITNYRVLLYLLKNNSRNLSSIDDVVLKASIKGRRMFVGDVKEDKGLALQLLKSERYTGITSSEHNYTDTQITTYVSKEVLLIALLGLYSSFIVKSDNMHYFLFFSVDELNEMLSGIKDARIMFLLKNEVREVLEEIIRRYFGEDLIVTETMINIKLQEALATYNVDSLSLLLFKVAQEGHTYKAYESLPITIFLRERRELYKILESIVSPRSVVLERLRDNKNVEYNNLVSVIAGLHRFVVLNDKYGIYVALRELYNAYTKVKNDEKLLKTADQYAMLLKGLSHIERIL